MRYIKKRLKPSIILLLSIIFILGYFFTNYSHTTNLTSNELKIESYHSLEILPVLHEGRIKPLDSYARVLLKSISNKESINDQSAGYWLIELLLDPKKDYRNKIFYIHNPEVQQILELSSQPRPYYSFKDIIPGIKKNINLITQLQNAPINSLTLAEEQLVTLYKNIVTYFDISRSWSLFLPQANHVDLNTILPNNNIKTDHISYYELLPFKHIIAQNVVAIYNSNNLNNSNNAQVLLKTAKIIKETESDRINTSLKLIPSQLEKNTDWIAPWEIIASGKGTPDTAIYLSLIQNIVFNFYDKDYEQMLNNSNKLEKKALQLISSSVTSEKIDSYKQQNILYTEYLYNKYKLFNKSAFFYFLALVTSVCLLLNPSQNKLKIKTLHYVCTISFFTALLFHLIGLVMRVFILQRPPVANLYESILFVSFITALLAQFIEIYRKDKIGVLLGSSICCILQFIAGSYAASGDSLGILIAVLNNNFWLGTHVIAITIGYACCLILSALAHSYLFYTCLTTEIVVNNTKKLKVLLKYILAFGLLSLFFTLLGTILGGIWADQSWGRFWGWDPKENGALLICLWLITLLHGRISGHLRDTVFVAFAALTSIIVAIAWFGVNLLSTGLHSYGFTENIATNLILFIIFELFLVLGLAYINKKKLKLYS